MGMKRFERSIRSNIYYEKVSKAIRKKEDVILLLLETMKIFLIDDIFQGNDIKGKVILNIEKMSRVVFELENKYFSFNFPFSVEDDVDGIGMRIYDSVSGVELDSKNISVLIRIFNEKLKGDYLIEDIYYKLASEDEINNLEEIRYIVERLIFFESGYLRYDYDNERKNGSLHPEHHFDINFSPSSTFKVGLNDRIDVDRFIDVLDLKTDCYYLYECQYK